MTTPSSSAASHCPGAIGPPPSCTGTSVSPLPWLPPLSSEAALFAVLKLHPDLFWAAVGVATLANTAGGMTNYLIGRLIDQSLPQVKLPAQVARVRRWGAPATGFGWLPFIGDALCLAAGWLKLNWAAVAAWQLAGRGLRYWRWRRAACFDSYGRAAGHEPAPMAIRSGVRCPTIDVLRQARHTASSEQVSATYRPGGTQMKQELLIGCGSNREKRLSCDGTKTWTSLTTLDFNDHHKPDVVWDLHELPLPFPPEFFDEIHAYEVLEHVGRQGDWRVFFAQFNEFWRILKPGGHLAATCPSWHSPWAWGDPSHTRVLQKENLVFLNQPQ